MAKSEIRPDVKAGPTNLKFRAPTVEASNGALVVEAGFFCAIAEKEIRAIAASCSVFFILESCGLKLITIGERWLSSLSCFLFDTTKSKQKRFCGKNRAPA